MTCFHRFISCALIVALAFAVTSADAAQLSTLIDSNGSIQVGDKLFSNFTYANSGSMPASSLVNVSPYTDPLGNFGIEIQGSFVNISVGGSSTALLDYTVTVLDPTKTIVGSTLSANPAVLIGSGTSSATATFLPEDPLTLTVFSTVPGATLLATSGIFATNHQTLHVQTNITGSSITGTETMSFVRQTFVQVPEPATVTLLAIGLGAICFLGRRNRSAK
jgi:PEP-CTERM motif